MLSVFDHDLSLFQRIEDFTVQQLVAQLLSSGLSLEPHQYLPTLCHQHINLPKLRNDLFACMPFPRH